MNGQRKQSIPTMLFSSEAREDIEMRDQLEEHLGLLKEKKDIDLWHNGQIVAGEDWGLAVDQHLENARIILLLISSSFLASNYCCKKAEDALVQFEAGKAVVIPVILRPCAWEGASFSHLQPLPRDRRPITRWEDPDEAYVDIVQGLRTVIRQLSHEEISEPLLSLEAYKRFVRPGLSDASSAEAERQGKDPDDITDKFLAHVALRIQVKMGQVWYVFRDRVFYKKLEKGPHTLWNTNILLGTWQVLRVDTRSVSLTFLVDGRIRGPALPQGASGEANNELGLAVKAKFTVLCKLENVERFLNYEEPVEMLRYTIQDLVYEMLPTYSYDQYGMWARKLAHELQRRLQQGSNRIDQHIGIRIKQILLSYHMPNDLYDTNMKKIFELAEQNKRVLEKARILGVFNVIKVSYAQQEEFFKLQRPNYLLGEKKGDLLMTIEIGLRGAKIAVGLIPSVTVTPLVELQSSNDASASSNAKMPLFAIARIALEEDDKAFVSKEYTLQAGVSCNKQESFEDDVNDMGEGIGKSVELEVELHMSDDIELLTEAQKLLSFNIKNQKTELVTFPFKATVSGHHFLDINFCYQQRWLRTIHLLFEAIVS